MKDETIHNDQSVEGRIIRMNPGIWAAGVGALILLAAIGFVGGVLVGRAGTNNNLSAQGPSDSFQGPGDMQGDFPNGQRMGMLGGLTGEVTEVSSSKITVKEARTGGLVSFDITSETEVTDDGDDAAIGDVQVGDTVQIQGTDNTDDSVAGTITRNPSTPTRGQFQ